MTVCDRFRGFVIMTHGKWPTAGNSSLLHNVASTWVHTVPVSTSTVPIVDSACSWCRSRHGLLPPYLADDCQLLADTGRRQLRSSDVATCSVLRTRSSLGDRCFAVAGPRTWNSLPIKLRQPNLSLEQFRRLLIVSGAQWTDCTSRYWWMV